MKMQFRKRLSALCCAAVIALTGCSAAQEAVPELQEPQGTAQLVYEVRYGDLFDVSILDGYVVPVMQEAALENPAIVLSVDVILGQHVEAGESLLTLDVEKAQKQADAISAKLSFQEKDYEYANLQAELGIEIARKELQKMESSGASALSRTQKQQSIDLQLLQYEQQKETQAYELQKLRNQLEDALLGTQTAHLAAPVSGTVVFAAPMRKGSQVDSVDTLFILALDDTMMIESEFIRESDFVRGKTEARIGENSYALNYIPMDNREYVSRMLAGKTIHSFYEFQDADPDVKVGDYAAIMMYSHVAQDTLFVPLTALYSDENGRFVYVLNADGTRSRRELKIGEMTSIAAQVLEGLEEGEKVCVKE